MLRHGCRTPIRRDQAYFSHKIADVAAGVVRVAVDRATNRPWRSRPRFERGEATADRPANQTVHRDSGLGTHEFGGWLCDRSHLQPEHDAANSLVCDDDV
jgi:hypothetical protein